MEECRNRLAEHNPQVVQSSSVIDNETYTAATFIAFSLPHLLLVGPTSDSENDARSTYNTRLIKNINDPLRNFAQNKNATVRLPQQ